MLRTASEKMEERNNRGKLCLASSLQMLMMNSAVFAGDKEKRRRHTSASHLVLQGFLNSNNISLTSLSKLIACSFY